MADHRLCEVVLRGSETKDLDYKAASAWGESDKKACCELVKDILAMANTLGGYIVVGVSEVEGRWMFDGLNAAQLRTWDTTRVNRFLQNYADPPINVSLEKPECDGKTFVVLAVPRFRDTPHICQRDYPGVLAVPGLYVRSDNNESVLLRESADLRAIIEQAIRNRQDQMLEAMRAIMTGASLIAGPSDREQFEQAATAVLAEIEGSDPPADKGYEGYWTSVMFPSRFESRRFGISDLQRAAAGAQVTYRGWPFIFYQPGGDTKATNNGIRTLSAWQPWGRDSYDHWVLEQSGLFVHKVLLHEDAYGIEDADERKVIDPNTIIFYVTEAIDALVRLYSELGIADEEVTWRVQLLGAKGRRLRPTDSRRIWSRRHYVAESDSVTWEQAHAIEEWRSGHVDLAMATCREIFARFQFLGATDAVMRDWITKLLDRNI